MADAQLGLEHRSAALHWMDWRGQPNRMHCAQQVFCGWFLNLLLGKVEPLRYSSVQGSKFFQIPLRNKRDFFEPVIRMIVSDTKSRISQHTVRQMPNSKRSD